MIKDRPYTGAVGSVLVIWGSEMRPLRSGDVRMLSVFERHCLRGIGETWWENLLGNQELKRHLPNSIVYFS